MINMDTCWVIAFVLPETLDRRKRGALLKHLSIFLRSFKRSAEGHGLYILTNSPEIVYKELTAHTIDASNATVNAVQLKELRYCSGHDGESFEFAFSKLDALTAICQKLPHFPSLKTVILSDIDACIVHGNNWPLVHSRNGTMQAINYRSEQAASPDFDSLISELGTSMKYHDRDFSINQAAWINSGFVTIPVDMLPDICEKLVHGIVYLKANKEKVKTCCANHYGDEILLSAIFNHVPGSAIPLKSNRLAQFIWTCHTANNTFHWVSMLNPPIHLHLPALKFLPRQLSTLDHVSRCTLFASLRIPCLVNLLSIESRNVDVISQKSLRWPLKALFAIAYKILAI